MSDKIDVLDHGCVRLVNHMGGDLAVVRAARVSHDADWRAGDDEGGDARLIRYLMRNGHTSPFEHVQFTFEVKAPIFVLRQWMRHRTWSFSEISMRYTVVDEPEFYTPTPGLIGVQSKSSKQARVEVVLSGEDLDRRAHEAAVVRHAAERAADLYRKLLASGWPRELARTVLPVSVYSRMFATADLHNLFHFLELRLHEHAQYEIRVYAEAMLTLIRPIAPACVAAWKESNGVQP